MKAVTMAVIFAFFATTATLSTTTARAATSTFDDVWTAVSTGAYATLPTVRSTFSSFFSGGEDLLATSADRTLWDDRDVLPRFQKLVHPTGICFAGTWSMTAASPYTGYFAKGSKGLIIVRASEALGASRRGDFRAFGFAGKIFPGTDPGFAATTANFFTVDDLGGALAPSFLDDPKTNEPKTSFHLSQLVIFPMITEIARTFAATDANPGIRQVYQIAELGLNDSSTARSPHWMQLRAETTTRVNAVDYRDELRLAHYPSGLDFGVFVADDDGEGWTRLGQIHLDREALSDGCDHRLHFQHPPSK